MKLARSSGFTIVEVMVVLAVTALLFVSAVALISGRSNQAEFDQSVQAVGQQIQDTINEVSDGDYNNYSNFQCTPPSSAGGAISITAGSEQQGANSGCTFLGKVLQFGVSNTNPEQFLAYPIAGLQLDPATGQTPTSYSNAQATAIAPGTSVLNSNIPNNAVENTLDYGLTTLGMTYSNGGNPVQIGGFGFLYSLSSYNGGSSGATQVSLVPIQNSQVGNTEKQMANAIDSNIATSPVNPSGGVTVCFKSGSTKQYGIITIGGTDNSQLAVNLQITSSLTGAQTTECA